MGNRTMKKTLLILLLFITSTAQAERRTVKVVDRAPPRKALTDVDGHLLVESTRAMTNSKKRSRATAVSSKPKPKAKEIHIPTSPRPWWQPYVSPIDNTGVGIGYGWGIVTGPTPEIYTVNRRKGVNGSNFENPSKLRARPLPSRTILPPPRTESTNPKGTFRLPSSGGKLHQKYPDPDEEIYPVGPPIRPWRPTFKP